MKTQTDFSHFESLDIRIGRIIKVEDSNTTKPTYRIKVDFGPEVGTKVSCGAFRNYTKDELTGRLVAAVINFPPKKMGPETSEVLILGALNERSEVIFLTPESSVETGQAVF